MHSVFPDKQRRLCNRQNVDAVVTVGHDEPQPLSGRWLTTKEKRTNIHLTVLCSFYLKKKGVKEKKEKKNTFHCHCTEPQFLLNLCLWHQSVVLYFKKKYRLRRKWFASAKTNGSYVKWLTVHELIEEKVTERLDIFVGMASQLQNSGWVFPMAAVDWHLRAGSLRDALSTSAVHYWLEWAASLSVIPLL